MTEDSNVVPANFGSEPGVIPMFEGHEVKATKAQVTSVSALEIADSVFRMDEIVKMVVEGRVINVQHKVNAKGDLERIHTVKAIDALVLDSDMDLDTIREGLS